MEESLEDVSWKKKDFGDRKGWYNQFASAVYTFLLHKGHFLLTIQFHGLILSSRQSQGVDYFLSCFLHSARVLFWPMSLLVLSG